MPGEGRCAAPTACSRSSSSCGASRRCGRATSARRWRCRSGRSTATSRDLMASGVPIEGEAGVGYVLRAGFDLPPLMFKEAEIEALVLGARIVGVLGRRGARRGGERRDRQDRGGDPGAAARLSWRARRCWRRRCTSWSRSASTSPSCAGRCGARSRCISAIPTCCRAAASGRCGRCRWPTSGRSGCWRPGASCATDFRTFRLDRIEGFAVTAERFRPEPGRRCTTS